MSRHEAAAACYPIGGELAQLQYSSDYTYLRDCLDMTAWIASLDGKMHRPVVMHVGRLFRSKQMEGICQREPSANWVNSVLCMQFRVE